jgi:hypothetical protein
MHPYTTELLAQFREEHLRETARALRVPWSKPRSKPRSEPARRTRLRAAVGFWLVGLGLRIAVPAPAVGR